jgi:hypothetical protein
MIYIAISGIHKSFYSSPDIRIWCEYKFAKEIVEYHFMDPILIIMALRDLLKRISVNCASVTIAISI